MAQKLNNVDDLRKQIEADEVQDKLELAADGLVGMSIREYARARGLVPQNVYYYVRSKRIEVLPCPCCGRKIINVKQADAIFLEKKENDDADD
jgi:AcrR family transcriptional regulator